MIWQGMYLGPEWLLWANAKPGSCHFYQLDFLFGIFSLIGINLGPKLTRLPLAGPVWSALHQPPNGVNMTWKCSLVPINDTQVFI